MSGVLDTFEGDSVVQMTIALKNAGDGLSKAITTEPRKMRIGDKGVLVIEFEVTAVDHKVIKDTGTLQRQHDLRAGTATFVERELVAQVLEAQEGANRRAAELAKGIEPIGGFVEPPAPETERAAARARTAAKKAAPASTPAAKPAKAAKDAPAKKAAAPPKPTKKAPAKKGARTGKASEAAAGVTSIADAAARKSDRAKAAAKETHPAAGDDAAWEQSARTDPTPDA